MKFQYTTWSHDSSKIDLRNESDVVDTSYYMESSDWDLIGSLILSEFTNAIKNLLIIVDTKANRTVVLYECCPNPFVDVSFYVHLRRRTLSYGANLILPTLVTSLMAILVFTLPSESGEKVALGKNFRI